MLKYGKQRIDMLRCREILKRRVCLSPSKKSIQFCIELGLYFRVL
ncbi:hypothetical protein PADK2_14540 [Pseudomonas aeruginosa DK2]|nr:hypothetical protein PADK2_14540 [Pseudomonas aeruginosa DK2]KFB21572.1 hypothetical protein PGPR2_16825 [Pseudomonas aeruginosa PGPR2]